MSSADAMGDIQPALLRCASPPPAYDDHRRDDPASTADVGIQIPAQPGPDPAHDGLGVGAITAPIVMWCAYIVICGLTLASHARCPMEEADGHPNIAPAFVVAAGPMVLAWVRHAHPRYGPHLLGMAYAGLLVLAANKLNANDGIWCVLGLATVCCCGVLALAIRATVRTHTWDPHGDAWHADRSRAVIPYGTALIPSIMVCFVLVYFMVNFRWPYESMLQTAAVFHWGLTCAHIMFLASFTLPIVPCALWLAIVMDIYVDIVSIAVIMASMCDDNDDVAKSGLSSAAYAPIVQASDMNWMAWAIVCAMATRMPGLFVAVALRACQLPQVRAAIRELGTVLIR